MHSVNSANADIRTEAGERLTHLLDLWFPRCLAESGFHQAFARDWTREAENSRFLVYQSRLTWVAAKAAVALPDRFDEFTGYASHGIAALSGPLFDLENGGHFWVRGVDGGEFGALPDVKRTYGLAFALFALSAAARVLTDPATREMARDAFEFLENLHDNEFGGYFEAAEADGTPLAVTRPNLEGRAFGPSHGTSFKAQNTHLHVLEALLEFRQMAPNSQADRRVGELIDLFVSPFYAEPGVHRTRFTADWSPLDDRWEIGHDLEAAYLLLESSPEPKVREIALKLVRFNTVHGFDRDRGGFFDSGPHPGEVGDRTKVWWVQAEGLNALGAAVVHDPDVFQPILERQWAWFRDFQWDREHGGVFGRLDESGLVVGAGAKAEPWKACYHDVRALLNLADL